MWRRGNAYGAVVEVEVCVTPARTHGVGYPVGRGIGVEVLEVHLRLRPGGSGGCEDAAGNSQRQYQTAKARSNGWVSCIFHTSGYWCCCATEREPYLGLCSFALG